MPCAGHQRLALVWRRKNARAKSSMTKKYVGGSMFPSLKALAVAFLLLGGLTAAHAQEKVWKHGILEAKSDAGFIAMVDKGGFAAKRGLRIELLQIKAGATLMKALVSGEIDSVDMGAAESIVAGVRGTGVKIVGCTWPGVPQVVLAKAEIKTLADLKGKTVAISSPGSLPDLLFRGMLDAANIPFSDVKLATQGADLDRYKSLVAGITDAAVVSNEFEAVMPSKCSPRAGAPCPSSSDCAWRPVARFWPSAGTISSNSSQQKWMPTNTQPRTVTRRSRWL